jgi:hypothetical protein
MPRVFAGSSTSRNDHHNCEDVLGATLMFLLVAGIGDARDLSGARLAAA